jgi:hypothetical protein
MLFGTFRLGGVFVGIPQERQYRDEEQRQLVVSQQHMELGLLS